MVDPRTRDSTSPNSGDRLVLGDGIVWGQTWGWRIVDRSVLPVCYRVRHFIVFICHFFLVDFRLLLRQIRKTLVMLE